MAAPERNLRRVVLAFAAALAAVAVFFVATGLGDQEPGGAAEADETLPPWLIEVYPPPGAETSSVSAVEVEFDAPGRRTPVRLLVDGTDVTTYARPGRGQLHYEPEPAPGPVPLDAGRHEAVVELVRLRSYGDRHEVIDSFRWTFKVL